MKLKLFTIQKSLRFFTDLKFAILILLLIALGSSLGSIIEQDEPLSFYQQNYSEKNPIYGFINWKLIRFLGLDHLYTTWWFFFLLIILSISLISCTITRQFPLFFNSKEYFFKKQKTSFQNLPFFVRMNNIHYFEELTLLKIQKLNFYIYQKNNLIYAYKGLIGRISPILVHLSLIIILGAAALAAFQNFKAQEFLAKGEVFHIQNTIRIGSLTNLPSLNVRINDFWVTYQNNRIKQFYSNLSILDNYGKELKQQTISVNNPLRYKNIDFYQSDWNLLGLRIKKIDKNNQTMVFAEIPLFSLKENTKSWISWVQTYTLIFDQLQNVFFIYNQDGKFLKISNIGDIIPITDSSIFQVVEILPATGLLIKYDPSISLIYFGFGLLMITTLLSYFPYTQIWIFNQKPGIFWLGSSTNRGKIQLEIEFENFLRNLENILFDRLSRF
jgi:cytochrome c biogenesis protein